MKKSSSDSHGCSYLKQEARQAVSASVVKAISSSASSSARKAAPSSALGAGANPVVIDSVIKERQAEDSQNGLSAPSKSAAVDDAFSKVLKQGIAKLSGGRTTTSSSGASTESFDNLKKKIERGLEKQQKSSTKAENPRQQLLLTEVELHH